MPQGRLSARGLLDFAHPAISMGFWDLAISKLQTPTMVRKM
jgi:hypothetical protein